MRDHKKSRRGIDARIDAKEVKHFDGKSMRKTDLFSNICWNMPSQKKENCKITQTILFLN